MSCSVTRVTAVTGRCRIVSSAPVSSSHATGPVIGSHRSKPTKPSADTPSSATVEAPIQLAVAARVFHTPTASGASNNNARHQPHESGEKPRPEPPLLAVIREHVCHELGRAQQANGRRMRGVGAAGDDDVVLEQLGLVEKLPLFDREERARAR